ncbi:MAG TPA: EamA family transporter, partial [Actinomycetota bacterium]|nr:EamA family transporter [Actinomycetota bacterium]
ILFRAIGGDRVRGGTLFGVLIGFSGVAILVLPGSRPAGATLVGVVLLIFAAASWAFGSVLSTRFDMPQDLMVSSGYQMITGGVALVVGGLIRGETAGFDPQAWSLASLAGMAYLITIGSLVGFTAYAWLLQNAPISKVSTYAYVNPVVAIILGWLILSESITTNTLVGAAVIVGSVAFIVRKEAEPEVQDEPQPALVGVESA